MRYLVISLLLLAASASAQVQPVSPRLDSMRVAVFRMLNMNTSGDRGTTEADATLAINLAQFRVSKDFPAVKKYDTVYIGADSAGGTLPSDYDRMEEVVRVHADSVRIGMTILDVRELDTKFPDVQDNIYQKSGAVDYKSPRGVYMYGGKINLHPKFHGIGDSTIALEVMYYALADRLVAASDSCVIEGDYISDVLFYAASLLSVDRLDYEAAAHWLSMYSRDLPKREEVSE